MCAIPETVVEDESKIGPWYPVYNLTQRGDFCDYNSVKHLEQIILTTTSLGILWRTGMEYCRINGLTIEHHYDLSNDAVRSTFYQMKNVPMYKEIPMALRGRALSE